MSRSKTLLLCALATAVAGCALDGNDDDTVCTDGKCDADGDDLCEIEGRYGDGACDASCLQPDIDCFMMFDGEPAARTWFADFERTMAQAEGRAPRALVATSDPRFERMHALLVRGWEAYAQVLPVGLLDRAPELVVIADDSANAFVTRDIPSNRAAWAVFVHTGALTDQPDHAVLGLVMHELTHAVKLHVLPGIDDTIRIHYQVFPGEREPLGYQQKDDAHARDAITAWRSLGDYAGPVAYEELNGMPFGNAHLGTVLRAALAGADPGACESTFAAAAELQAVLTANTSPLDNLLTLTTAAARIDLDRTTRRFLGELRTKCLATSTLDLFTMLAERFGVTPAEMEAEFPAAERQLVEGRHLIDQITLLASDRHRRMREIAALFEQQTGGDLATLRYFSHEEQADDSTLPVLRALQVPETGVGEFFHRILPAGVRQQCDAVRAAGETPPYGDLVDPHHATCWRIAHVDAMAASRGAPAARLARPPSIGEVHDYTRIAGPRLPRWRRLADEVTH
jgi:hypothetical protein